jgi:AAA15 family ATPase/GTPase
MIIELKVENFLSFKEEVVFSLLKCKTDDNLKSNYIKFKSLNILKSSVIFGPNASGKSNLLQTLHFLKFLVSESRKFDKKKEVKYLPFKLNSKYREELPIKINLKYLINKNIYDYKISICKNKKIDKNYSFIISSEVLTKNNETLFERNESKVISNNENMNKTLVKLQTNKNALFLSTSETLGFDDLAEAYSWFRDKLVIDLDSNKEFGLSYTSKRIKEDPKFKTFVLKYLNKGDFGKICNIKISERKFEFPDNMDKELQEIILNQNKYQIETFHKDDKDKEIPFDFNIEESQGNIKYLGLLGPIYDMLETDKVFIVDELDKSLHPEILKLIFTMIHESQSKSQIISSTHSFPLLMYVNNSDAEIFRRDQIWFTRKNKDQATELYSLINIGGIRTDLRIFKAYFDGRLDAFPNIK